jgi:hypothetical protein
MSRQLQPILELEQEARLAEPSATGEAEVLPDSAPCRIRPVQKDAKFAVSPHESG